MSVLVGLRAPQEDGAVLAEPALEAVGTLLAQNRRRLVGGPTIAGRDWKELRREAQRAAVQAALDYLAADPLEARTSSGALAGTSAPLKSTPDATSLLLAGHQPELFHPGVWVKNFALCGLARRYGLTPLNLIVDNDTVKATALHVPVVSVPLPPVREQKPHRLAIPFDRWTEEVPYEERTVLDEEAFATLPDRVRPNWGFEPLLREFWSEVLRQAGRTPLLGERLTAARRTVEQRWGCQNLELPISRLCDTEPFAWFACHLLAELAAFHELHNHEVHDYRRRHGLRSRSHPVPDLAAEGDWLEAPFWAWQAGQTRRGRLFVRRLADRLQLRAGQALWPSLPLPAGKDFSPMVRGWLDLSRAGFKVRSRALTNTLYARLFLADLFIHGIGGGKYDELTDRLIAGFFRREPPAFLVLSATLLLPLPCYPATPAQWTRLNRQVRDLHWNPQRHLDEADPANGRARELSKQKQQWISRSATDRQQRRERFLALRRLTEELRRYVIGREQQLHEELHQCEEELEANRILTRRDYAFCLYPETQLRPFCTRFLEV